MELFGGRVRAGVRSGEPFAVAGASITPRSWSAVVQLPFWAFVWNTPIGIDVNRNGIVERAVVVDVTRWMLVGLTVIAILGGNLGIRKSLQKGVDG